jgi:hypothetical protein
MLKSAFAAALAATLCLVACRSRQPDVVIQRESQPPSTVIIEKDHSHGAGCGHYYYNGHWYAEPTHVHIVD